MVIITNTSFTQVAEGQSGSQVAAILNDTQAHVYGSERYQFTQADIADYLLSYTHNKNTLNVKATLYDNNGVEQLTAGLFTRISSNAWSMAFSDAIVGNWELIINYLP